MICSPLTDPEPLAAENGPRPTVLIVDDDSDMVEVLATRLQRQGFATLSDLTGRHAVEMARQMQPAVVLLDLRLPDADGLTICRALSDDPVTADIPVIVVSGMERPDVVRAARAAGSRFYLRKPYDPNALLLLIEHTIDQTRGWEEF